MFSILKKIGLLKPQAHQQSQATLPTIQVDMHSHLLPAIDDGSKSIEESLQLIQCLVQLGYRKLITTPHIMSDFYKNTPEIIDTKLKELQKALQDQQIAVEIEAAAEYYFDEWFIRQVRNGDKLLTFGDNYLLFETNFYNKPAQLFEVIFDLQSQGYKPVFAHPERYIYLQSDFKILEKIAERGVFLQLNLNSLSGYYDKPAQDFAEKMLDRKFVHFVGSDCHSSRHIEALKRTQTKKSFAKLAEFELLNNTL
ncbi:MAG: capsular biosynthesis protein [Microscillaceae bacterium]|jgi:tyrosine-protein phosphatase YwqE|nr:capsular biosynthesis protein [Microscillaceae bacterium]